MVFNRAGMQKRTVAYGYIVAQNAGMAVGNVQHAVILNIGISANFNFINIAADGYVIPYAAVFFQFCFADNYCGFGYKSLRVNFRRIAFKFFNKHCKIPPFMLLTALLYIVYKICQAKSGVLPP